MLCPTLLRSSGPCLPHRGWERPGGKLVTRQIAYFSSATFIPVFNPSVGNWVEREMPAIIIPSPLWASVSPSVTWEGKAFPAFFIGYCKDEATLSGPEPFGHRVLALRTTQTQCLASGGSPAGREAQALPTTSRRLEGRAGGAWPVSQACERLSAKGVTELLPGCLRLRHPRFWAGF